MKASCCMLLNNRGSSLIFVVSLAIILNIVFVTVYMTVSSTQKKTGVKRLNTNSILLAEAGKEKLYADLKTCTISLIPNQRKQIYTDYILGKGTFSVSCSTNVSVDTVWVESWGKDQTSETGIGVVASVTADDVVAAFPVRAAVTSRPAVDLKGTICIDGRDYDSNGVATGDPGVFGISTCSTLGIGSGAADVAGNNKGPYGKKASAAEIALVAEQGIAVSPSLASPEAFLGVPAGSLDKYKISAADLTLPFHGIRYVETSIGPLHLGGSSGILIIHSPMKNATTHLNSTGIFKGIIIVDEMDKMNGNVTVIGAIACLADFAAAKKFGNGNADVKYSSYVLNNLGKFILDGDKSVKELSWKELKR
jgi:hypothetical protein